MDVKSQPVKYREDALWALYLLFGLMLVIVGLIALYANQPAHGWGVFAGGSLAALAAFAAGGLVGVLFGVPHSAEKSTTSTGSGSAWGLLPNTSLDQISDWLTKILVGVGLTQLYGIPSKLQALASYLAPVFGGTSTDAAAGFGLTVVISSSVLGFIAAWVWMRLLLSVDLAQAGLDIQPKSQEAVTVAEAARAAANPSAKPIEAKNKEKAVNLTAKLAKTALQDVRQLPSSIGFAPEDLLRIQSEGLDTSDYQTLAEHAIKEVTKEKTGSP